MRDCVSSEVLVSSSFIHMQSNLSCCATTKLLPLQDAVAVLSQRLNVGFIDAEQALIAAQHCLVRHVETLLLIDTYIMSHEAP